MSDRRAYRSFRRHLRPRQVEPHDVLHRVTEVRRVDATGEVGRDGTEDVPGVKGGADTGAEVVRRGQLDDLDRRLDLEHVREDSVVGPDEVRGFGYRDDRAAG